MRGLRNQFTKLKNARAQILNSVYDHMTLV